VNWVHVQPGQLADSVGLHSENHAPTNRIFGHRDELGHNVRSFFPEETEISIETMKVGFESELTHPRRRDPQGRLPVTYDRPPDNEAGPLKREVRRPRQDSHRSSLVARPPTGRTLAV